MTDIQVDPAYNWEYRGEISTGGQPVYARTEGSNEYLQMVYRKESDIAPGDRQNWAGPIASGTVTAVRFVMTIVD